MEHTKSFQNSFAAGLRDGVPIGLGYFSVSMTFGILCVLDGLPVWAAVAISMTNLTSGTVCGLSLICAHSSLFEMALTQLVINLRYALMSLSLSQKLPRTVRLPGRLGISYFITDERFLRWLPANPAKWAAAISAVWPSCPYLGWTLGTLCGAVASGLLPDSVRSAFGIALYGMFLAIVIPVARKSRAVLGVVCLAVALSCAMRFVPLLNSISSGFAIILCTVIAAGLGAVLAPVPDREEEEDHADA